MKLLTKVRRAFLKDFNQYMIDSLTPDRGYGVPVDNLMKLFVEKNPTKWKCRRCKEIVDMKKFRCGCTVSPSPWEPV